MEEKAYFCPHCKANRTRFKVIRRESQRIQKDAFNGEIISMNQEEPYVTDQGELEVECLSCDFTGYEMMFVKAAEREPRIKTEVQGRT